MTDNLVQGDSKMVKCHICGKDIADGEPTFLENEETKKIICVECNEYEYTHCDKCNEHVCVGDTTSVNYDGEEHEVCESCAEDFIECDGCGALVPFDEIGSDSYGNDYCEDCYAEDEENEEEESELCYYCDEPYDDDGKGNDFDLDDCGSYVKVCSKCLKTARKEYLERITLRDITTKFKPEENIIFNTRVQNYLKNKEIRDFMNEKLKPLFHIVRKIDKTYRTRIIGLGHFLKDIQEGKEIDFPDWYIKIKNQQITTTFDKINTEYAKRIKSRVMELNKIQTNTEFQIIL